MNKELEEAKRYLEHEVEVYENNREINQLIGGKAGEKQHEAYKIVLQALDNSVSKDKIKELVKEMQKNGSNCWAGRIKKDILC